jgi:hypothetical protein
LKVHARDQALQIVSQHAHIHSGFEVFERFGNEVCAAHPGFWRAKDMLDGPATNTYGLSMTHRTGYDLRLDDHVSTKGMTSNVRWFVTDPRACDR